FPLRKERHCWGLSGAIEALPGSMPRRLLRQCGASVVTARGAVANRTEIPMRLTDTQLVLLSAASQREDRGIGLATNLKGAAAHKVVGRLLTGGLVEETPAGGALPVWRRDDAEGAFALRITARGLAAIQVDGAGDTAEAPEPGNAEQGAAPPAEKPLRR